MLVFFFKARKKANLEFKFLTLLDLLGLLVLQIF